MGKHGRAGSVVVIGASLMALAAGLPEVNQRSNWRRQAVQEPEGPSPTPPSKQTSSSAAGTCLPYRGQVCAPYRTSGDAVFVAWPDTAAIVEERVRAALSVISNSPDLTQECAAYAAPAVCLSAFPPCDNSTLSPTPRAACRDECEFLRDVTCKREYAIARAHALIGRKVSLPVCEDLPPVSGSDSAATSCVRLGVKQVAPPRVTEVCYTGDGANFRGAVNSSASGRPCLPWTEALNYDTFSKSHPLVMGGHNFCRSWGPGLAEPWCFTAARLGQPPRAETCAVPRCASPLLRYIILPGVGTALCLGVAAIITGVCWCLLVTRRRSAPQEVITKLTDSPVTVVAEKDAAKLKQPDLEIPFNQLSFKEELGEGAFGKVYLGELQLLGSAPPLMVAIKTLKEGASSSTRQDFTREWRLMSELQHPHIVRILAVVTKSSPSCIVFERMSFGDLHAYLQSHSPRAEAQTAPSVTGADGAALTEPELVDVAAQVADGMAYLAEHHYVHRDLAARNCLVGDKRTVKISDFGLSRDIYSSDYYRLNTRALLPVRWMPPESILYGKFTTESDVWSFGVLLWEIFSFGLQPYYGYSSSEVVEMVTRRQLLPRPDDAPAAVYDVMIDCWHQTPCRRPRFAELLRRLRGWRPDTGGMMSAAVSSSVQRLTTVSRDPVGSSMQSVASDIRPGHAASAEGLCGPVSSRVAVPGATGRGSASLPRPAPSSGDRHQLSMLASRTGGVVSASLPRPTVSGVGGTDSPRQTASEMMLSRMPSGGLNCG